MGLFTTNARTTEGRSPRESRVSVSPARWRVNRVGGALTRTIHRVWNLKVARPNEFERPPRWLLLVGRARRFGLRLAVDVLRRRHGVSECPLTGGHDWCVARSGQRTVRLLGPSKGSRGQPRAVSSREPRYCSTRPMAGQQSPATVWRRHLQAAHRPSILAQPRRICDAVRQSRRRLARPAPRTRFLRSMAHRVREAPGGRRSVRGGSGRPRPAAGRR